MLLYSRYKFVIIWFVNIYSHFVSCVFIFLLIFFELQTYLILRSATYQHFLLWMMPLVLELNFFSLIKIMKKFSALF
jgi:hypothetical protein